MNIHDARAVYTRKTIDNEFLIILKEKPVDRITVSELCERCHINRATFYKHNHDIYDLMEHMEQIMRDQIISLIDSIPAEDINSLLTGLLRSTRQFGKSWMVMFSPNGDPSLAEKLLHLCYEKGLPLIRQNTRNMTPSDQQRLYAFISHGSAGVMLDWISTGMNEPPEKVASFLEKSYDALLKMR